MGARDCFGISRKKVKEEASNQAKADSTGEKSNGSKSSNRHRKLSKGSPGKLQIPEERNEEMAATRIQTAFRAFLARRTVGRHKDVVKYDVVTRSQPVLEQISSTLSYMHSWSRIQSEIRARRIFMVTEARLKQKKLENQMKVEAKFHKLEVEWCGETGTMEEILGRIQQREEAAIKRERALAYAFSHQWRANASQYLGQTTYCLDKNGWGWSWLQHWVSARPWEVRVEITNPKKGRIINGKVSRPSKSDKHSEPKELIPDKPGLSNLY